MGQQTAVQRLFDLMPPEYKMKQSALDSYGQALEIEKEQTINAYIASVKAVSLYPLDDSIYRPDAEQYYNETYRDIEQTKQFHTKFISSHVIEQAIQMERERREELESRIIELENMLLESGERP